MTDFTADLTQGAHATDRVERPRSIPAAPKREFYAYFALIFLATLPLAFVTWTLTALRQFQLPEKNPFAKAWSQARIITPMIFHG